LRQLVLGTEQLAIGIENIGECDHAPLVSFLRGVARAL
jgi:hypothetical protein